MTDHKALIQRTVIVATNAVDGVVQLNKAMGHKLVSRYDTGNPEIGLVSVCVFEGPDGTVDLDRFYVISTPRNEYHESQFFDADGYYYSVKGSENASEDVRKKRAARDADAFVSLSELDALHTAWKIEP